MHSKNLLPDHPSSTGSALNKWLNTLCLVVILLFLASLLLGVFVPVYTDEVATKMVLARFFAEGAKVVTLFPQCGASFIVDTPFSFYPAAIVYSFLYAGLWPLGIRIAGIAMAFVWLALTYWWVVRAIPARQYRIYMLATIAAILGFGVLPFLMVLARSEQWLITLIGFYCLLPVFSKRILRPASILPDLGLLFVFVLATSLFFYIHPKAIFFFPLVIISAYYTFGVKRKLLLGLSISFILICSVQSVLLAKATSRCDSAPKLSAMLSSQTIDFSLIKTHPEKFIATAIKNTVKAPVKIVNHILFSDSYQSGWLPATNKNDLGFMVSLANGSAKTIFLVCIFCALILPFRFLWNARSISGRDERFFIIMALWVGLVGHLAIYNAWNFYSGALVLPLVIWMLVLMGADFFQLVMKKIWAKRALVIILLFSLASFCTLFFSVVPSLILTNYADQSFLIGQPLSVATFNFPSQRLRVRALANQCGIQGDGASRLIVDDLTYFAFDQLRQPLHMVYLYEGGFGADISGNKIKPFLAKMANEGIIAQCTYLPEMYKASAIRDGNYCCVKLDIDK